MNCCFSLQELDLSFNPRLEGKLPDYWGRLTNLQRLDLSNCGLSGKLPTTWVALQNVVSINLSNNMLGGERCSWVLWGSVGLCML
jgi:Ran GTPase-activating protein (RanGAP) involved in mRNA processing and transport